MENEPYRPYLMGRVGTYIKTRMSRMSLTHNKCSTMTIIIKILKSHVQHVNRNLGTKIQMAKFKKKCHREQETINLRPEARRVI